MIARAMVCCILLLCGVGRAPAASISHAEDKNLAYVVLSGEIARGDAEKTIAAIEAAAQQHKADGRIVTLALDSPGGVVIDAVQLGEFVERAKVPVLVTPRSNCESACFFIFMSSPAKLVAHGARIGVHSVSHNGQEDAETSFVTVRAARLARSAGVPQSVIGKMVTAAPGDMSYLSDSELKQMGVIFVDDDEDWSRAPQQTFRPQPVSPAPAQPQTAQPSGSVAYDTPGAADPLRGFEEEQRRAEIKAEQDRNFAKYWGQIVGWSKAQHSGTLASERRCNKSSCATVVAYFDRQQRYVEAWKYDPPPQGSDIKLVCRQIQGTDRLSCKDWYDEREFEITYTHQIGADMVTSNGDLFDIFR
jgi:hypothetical protein